ncbi:hypothetical protein PCE1_001977 [Barthelona sp. PCE]
MNFDLLTFANPIIDVCIEAPRSFVEERSLKFGETKLVDEASVFDNLPCKPTYVPGGSASNTIRALLATKLNVNNQIGITGAIGADEIGLVYTHAFEGCQTFLEILENESTSKCLCVTDPSGERSLGPLVLASNQYSTSFYNQTLESIEKSSICYLTGFFLLHSTDKIVNLMQNTEKIDRLMLNLSDAFVVYGFWDCLNQVFPHTSLLVGNHVEYTAVYEKLSSNPAEDNKMLAAMRLLQDKYGIPTLICTCGANDVIVLQDGTVSMYPVRAVDVVVDTNGAGDSFVGGLLAGILSGFPMEKCVALGNELAGYCLGKVGADYSGFEMQK